MKIYSIALFGEAEKGHFQKPHFCDNLERLSDALGHPPPDSRGLFFAIQALLYQREVFFFRVEEEGFSLNDYFLGLNFLEKERLTDRIAALCAPGVANVILLDTIMPFCEEHNQMLITNEADLYDFLTEAA